MLLYVIVEKKHSEARYSLVWLFDQSSGRCAYDTNARTSRCSASNEKNMTLPDSTPKGMKIVLEERGVDKTGMKKSQKLAEMHDFKYEKTCLNPKDIDAFSYPSSIVN